MASKRALRRKECSGKKRHASHGNAMVAVHLGGDAYRGCAPYLCQHCGNWHIGHPPGFLRFPGWRGFDRHTRRPR